MKNGDKIISTNFYIHRTKNQNANRNVFVLSSIFFFKSILLNFN